MEFLIDCLITIWLIFSVWYTIRFARQADKFFERHDNVAGGVCYALFVACLASSVYALRTYLIENTGMNQVIAVPQPVVMNAVPLELEPSEVVTE